MDVEYIENVVPLRDSFNKIYETHVISGFTLFIEENLFNEYPDVHSILCQDLEAVIIIIILLLLFSL